MKILHIIRSSNPENGGPIEGIRQLGSATKSVGNLVELACLDAPDAPWLRDFPLTVHALGPGRGKYGYHPTLHKWMAANAANYDIVVVNGIWQYHSFAAWRALRARKVPYVVFTHGMLDPWFKHTYPLKHIKKWMYWPWAEYRVLRDARAVLFTCEEERLLARESFSPYRVNEHVANYGTSKPHGDAAAQRAGFFAKYPELEGKRLALFMGRLHEKKGCDILLKAFAAALREPQWRLVIAGPDQKGLKAQLVKLSEQLGIADRVVWTGMVKGDIKAGAIEASEIFVLPSHQENFGIVVAEAMARGVPVLISNKVNIWREIEQDDAGIVGQDDVPSTIELLRRWNTMSEAERRAMGERARESFNQRFEIGNAASTLMSFFESVTNGHARI